MKCTKALKAWDGGGKVLWFWESTAFNSICGEMCAIKQLGSTSHTRRNAAGLQITGRKGTLPGLRGLSFQSWKAHKTTASIFLTSVHFRTESCFVLDHDKIRQLLVSQSLTVSFMMPNVFWVLFLYHGEPDSQATIEAKAFLLKAKTIYCRWLCLTVF